MHLAVAVCWICILQTASPVDAGIEEWRQDLSVLGVELPRRHVNPFTKTSREKFEADVTSLHGRIGSLTDHEIVVEMMRLMATIGDAHTSVHPGPKSKLAPFRGYPFGFLIFSDGPFVAVAPAERRELLGAKLIGVGDASFDQAAQRVATVFAAENESLRMHLLPRWMTNAQVLHALKLTDSGDRATFTFRLTDGTEKRVELTAIPPDTKPKLLRLPDRSKPGATLPVSLAPHSDKYWFEPVAGGTVVYCRYDSCVSDPKNPFDRFAKKLLDHVDSHDIDRVIVDLRRNGGGDSRVARTLITGLRDRPKINRKGKLFVLVGRATFSSAQMNAAEFRGGTNALIVGEPTGQKPNHFGEIRTFELPNSGLVVQYSTKSFRNTPGGDQPSMMPDITVEPTSAEFFSGRDVVLERVLTYQAK